jgi:hypothetical protein
MAAIERSDSIAALRRKADSRLTGVWVAFAGLGFNVTRATGHPRIAVDLAMAALAGLAANVAQRLIRRGGRRFEARARLLGGGGAATRTGLASAS